MFSAILSKAPLIASSRRVAQQPAIFAGSFRAALQQAAAAAATAAAAPSSQQQQVRHRSGRSRRGLYDGKDIRSGNNVSFSMRHTKRKFKPNVIIKRVYSETLDAMIKFHMTTSALRSIDKAGGLDNYLMKHEFTEGEGFKIKKAIKKRLKNQAYLERRKAKAAATETSEDVAASSTEA